MSPTVDQLRSWDPASFGRAAKSAYDNASLLDGSLEAVERALNRADSFFDRWSGQTHDAAEAAVRQERDHADELRTVLLQIADAAQDAETDITFARDFVLAEVEAARAGGFEVSPAGEVTHPDEEEKKNALAFTARIQNGLATAGEFDADYGRQIANLSSDLAAMIGGQPDVTIPGGRLMDPDSVVALLRSMTQDQRREFLAKMSDDDVRRLLQADPEFMGNTDGVPFVVRAEANETRIRDALADEERAGRGSESRANQLRSMLVQMTDPTSNSTPGRDALSRGPDDRRSERTFIVFENTRNGRVVEMIGSFTPNSRSATVYVPGTGTNLDGSGSNYNAAWQLAHQTDGPVFFYLDGDLPQSLGDGAVVPLLPGAELTGLGLLTGNPIAVAAGLGVMGTSVPDAIEATRGTAADPSFARDMAPRLVDFGRALDAEIAATAPDAQTTFIGHSYGGSVVGSAEQLGLRADRVIYASSAGTGVFDGEWNNANPNVERYSMTAPGDPIQYVQSLPNSPHGSDPDSASGVFRMDTGYWDSDDPAGGIVSGFDGHGKYWDRPDSTAFQNMVDVINGADPTPYVERQNDRVTDVGWSLLQTSSWVVPQLGLLVDGADGDIDLPGPIPDIPLKWPWEY